MKEILVLVFTLLLFTSCDNLNEPDFQMEVNSRILDKNDKDKHTVLIYLMNPSATGAYIPDAIGEVEFKLVQKGIYQFVLWARNLNPGQGYEVNALPLPIEIVDDYPIPKYSAYAKADGSLKMAGKIDLLDGDTFFLYTVLASGSNPEVGTFKGVIYTDEIDLSDK